jgi:hypothetical protein
MLLQQQRRYGISSQITHHLLGTGGAKCVGPAGRSSRAATTLEPVFPWPYWSDRTKRTQTKVRGQKYGDEKYENKKCHGVLFMNQAGKHVEPPPPLLLTLLIESGYGYICSMYISEGKMTDLAERPAHWGSCPAAAAPGMTGTENKRRRIPRRVGPAVLGGLRKWQVTLLPKREKERQTDREKCWAVGGAWAVHTEKRSLLRRPDRTYVQCT